MFIGDFLQEGVNMAAVRKIIMTRWRFVNLCIHLVVFGGCLVLLLAGRGGGPTILLLVACVLTASASVAEAWLRGRTVQEHWQPEA